MASHADVANAWIKQTGRRQNGSRMYYRGELIYSYGPHYLMAQLFLKERTVLLNEHDYSKSTMAHKDEVRSAANSEKFTIIEVKDPSGRSHYANLSQLSEKAQCLRTNLKTTKQSIRGAYTQWRRALMTIQLYKETFNVE